MTIVLVFVITFITIQVPIETCLILNIYQGREALNIRQNQTIPEKCQAQKIASSHVFEICRET